MSTNLCEIIRSSSIVIIAIGNRLEENRRNKNSLIISPARPRASSLSIYLVPALRPEAAEPKAKMEMVETAEVETAEVETAEVETAEVEMAEVEMAEVEMAEVEMAEVEMAEVEMAGAGLAEIPAAETVVEVAGVEKTVEELLPMEARMNKGDLAGLDGNGRERERPACFIRNALLVLVYSGRYSPQALSWSAWTDETTTWLIPTLPGSQRSRSSWTSSSCTSR